MLIQFSFISFRNFKQHYFILKYKTNVIMVIVKCLTYVWTLCLVINMHTFLFVSHFGYLQAVNKKQI